VRLTWKDTRASGQGRGGGKGPRHQCRQGDTPVTRHVSVALLCRRKIEMSPVVQSRNDTPVAADTLRAKRHVGRELGEGGGVKGRSRRSRCAKRSP
jgi:hypothetical protein